MSKRFAFRLHYTQLHLEYRQRDRRGNRVDLINHRRRSSFGRLATPVEIPRGTKNCAPSRDRSLRSRVRYLDLAWTSRRGRAHTSGLNYCGCRRCSCRVHCRWTIRSWRCSCVASWRAVPELQPPPRASVSGRRWRSRWQSFFAICKWCLDRRSPEQLHKPNN